jgi:Domain of unknown function (DUF4331)
MIEPTAHRMSALIQLVLAASLLTTAMTSFVSASSHREAPLIADDPQADNTDLYAFRSPDDPNTVTLIANYIPSELPNSGPNYYSFGENIRYEIHIDNNVSTAGDDIVYRFTFSRVNQDPTTYFNIRLGQQNLKSTYTAERSLNGGVTFTTIVNNGIVPPPNIGPRSIEDPTVGLGASSYDSLIASAITTASTFERIFCGPVDDPYFVDSGGLFDLGDAPRQGSVARDGMARFNTHTIAIQVPIATLQKNGLPVSSAANILDSDFVIGVWASSSRPATRTLNVSNGTYVDSGAWMQVSRLGMPLTNTVVVPIGSKDRWNAFNPYNELADTTLDAFFYNPELALYMDSSQLAASVPAFAKLRVPRNALNTGTPTSGFDFGNTRNGLFALKGTPAVAGTALDDALFGNLLLPSAGKPRSVDVWPLFHLGLPNLRPYQLATGKTAGNPLSAGKPFVNNFLPNGGDMLRLNMAVPVTPRNDPDFSSRGLVRAAELGLTDTRFNGTAALQFIPNMDGFPNGRRLEDDVTRINLQAISGVFLNAIGYWHDDFVVGGSNTQTTLLKNIFSYSTGVEANDIAFKSTFPYLASPWRGTEVGQ